MFQLLRNAILKYIGFLIIKVFDCLWFFKMIILHFYDDHIFLLNWYNHASHFYFYFTFIHFILATTELWWYHKVWFPGGSPHNNEYIPKRSRHPATLLSEQCGGWFGGCERREPALRQRLQDSSRGRSMVGSRSRHFSTRALHQSTDVSETATGYVSPSDCTAGSCWIWKPVAGQVQWLKDWLKQWLEYGAITGGCSLFF